MHMTSEEKQFRGWRLLGVIMIVVVLLALVSAAVDWMVIGPLEGRVFDPTPALLFSPPPPSQPLPLRLCPQLRVR
jgi:hypothetical protein